MQSDVRQLLCSGRNDNGSARGGAERRRSGEWPLRLSAPPRETFSTTAMSEAIPRPPTLPRFAAYFLRLGALGFGGPVALTNAMRRDLVESRAG